MNYKPGIFSLLLATAVFPQAFVVVSPNGGETFTPGQKVTVTWTASSQISNVALSYSVDNGASWYLIADWVPCAPGTYIWTAPFLKKQTTKALIRITADNVANPPSDVSDAPFTIQASAPDAYEPNNDTAHAFTITPGDSSVKNAVVIGGDSSQTDTSLSDVDFFRLNLTAGKLITISPFPAFVSDTVSFGGTRPMVKLCNQSLVEVAASTWGPFTYNVGQTGTYYIMVSTTPGSWAKYGLSVKQGDSSAITVVSPNGGETFTPGQKVTVTWTASSQISNVALSYSVDNGASWYLIADWLACAPGSYLWTAPFLKKQTTKALIRITADNVANPPSDVSDAPFTISASTPDAYEPNNDTAHAFTITPGDSSVKNAVVIGGDSSQTDTSLIDVDFFRLNLTAGKLITISPFPAFVSDTVSFGGTRPMVKLCNQSLVEVAASTWGPFTYNVGQTGTYYIMVSTTPGSWSKYGLSVKTVAILTVQTTKIDSSNITKVVDSSGTKYTVGITNDTTKLNITLTLNSKVTGSITTAVLAPDNFALAPGKSTNVKAISITADSAITSSMKSADITIPYSVADLNGAPESTIVVVWLNDSTSQWTPISFTLDTVNHIIVAHTTHFSVYGVFAGTSRTRVVTAARIPAVFGMRAMFERSRQSIDVCYSLPSAQPADIRLYNAKGACVRRTTLFAAAGYERAAWNCGDLGAGLYIVDFRAGAYHATSKIAVAR